MSGAVHDHAFADSHDLLHQQSIDMISSEIRGPMPWQVLALILAGAVFALAEDPVDATDDGLPQTDLHRELARSRAEVAKLRAKVIVAASELVGLCFRFLHVQLAHYEFADNHVDGLAQMTEANDETCSDHCNGRFSSTHLLPTCACVLILTHGPYVPAKFTGNCDIDTEDIDKDCVATTRSLDATKSNVVSVRTDDHPKWELRRSGTDEVLGTVSCPCSNSEGTLGEMTALRHILGQVGAMGVDQDVAKKVIDEGWQGGGYVTKIGALHVLACYCRRRHHHHRHHHHYYY